MAYNSTTGSQMSGDIRYENDPEDTQIDFENDSIKLKTGGSYRLVTNNSHVSASVNISGAALYVAGGILELHKSDSNHAQIRTETAHLQLRNKANNKDIRFQLGDTAGATGVKVRNNSSTEVASIDSQGNISGSGVLSIEQIKCSGSVTAVSFAGDGSSLTNLPAAAITTYNTSGDNRIITSVNSTTVQGESRLTFDGAMLHVSGNLRMQNTEPRLKFSNSAGTGMGVIGYNSANNILIQNDLQDRHIVFKTNDNGTIKEGFRLDGEIPEVVVNQTSDSLVDFRVESDNNAHMLYVQGSTDRVGINTNAPSHPLSVIGHVSASLGITGSSFHGNTEGLHYPIKTVAGAYSVTLLDYTILVNTASGNITVTLPAASAAKRKIYNIKKVDSSNTLTIATGGGTIDGAVSKTLTTLHESLSLHSNGTDWFII